MMKWLQVLDKGILVLLSGSVSDDVSAGYGDVQLGMCII